MYTYGIICLMVATCREGAGEVTMAALVAENSTKNRLRLQEKVSKNFQGTQITMDLIVDASRLCQDLGAVAMAMPSCRAEGVPRPSRYRRTVLSAS